MSGEQILQISLKHQLRIGVRSSYFVCKLHSWVLLACKVWAPNFNSKSANEKIFTSPFQLNWQAHCQQRICLPQSPTISLKFQNCSRPENPALVTQMLVLAPACPSPLSDTGFFRFAQGQKIWSWWRGSESCPWWHHFGTVPYAYWRVDEFCWQDFSCGSTAATIHLK